MKIIRRRRTTLLRIGDVVTSDLFAYGQYDSYLKKRHPQVGLPSPYACWMSADSNPKRQTGETNDGGRLVETLMYDASDETRKDAKFVVVEFVHAEGGPMGGPNSPHDMHPGGTKVVIQRLNGDGSFNPKGEKLFFYSTTGYINPIFYVTRVGRMERTFVPLKD